ncbi:MAG: efflux RND transporter periplasmic adaptor subunit [Spirochaetes bacterium]|nr:efflux RND transporter periplasmic adaptor subunit [Spirochaetota bacterium]
MKIAVRLIALVVAVSIFSCAKKAPEVWYCPMHKDYQTDHPGDCPICGMHLVKKESATDLPKANSPLEHSQHAAGNPPEKEPTNSNAHTITIAPDRQAMLGVATTEPKLRHLALQLRLPAQVAYETELYTALVEYRQLMLQSATMPEGISGAHLAASARLRVEQLGMGAGELGDFARSENQLTRLITGTRAGQALVTLQIAESEIALVRKGQRVAVSGAAFGEKKFSGRITGIGTLVDAKRRTFSVRALVGDAKSELRAQMFVTAEIQLDAGRGLSLPRSAIFNTGLRQVVFVKKSASEFEPRAVKILGGNDEYAIVSGIAEGDAIVVSSAFLLDSEARLKIDGYR